MKNIAALFWYLFFTTNLIKAYEFNFNANLIDSYQNYQANLAIHPAPVLQLTQAANYGSDFSFKISTQ